MGRFKSSPTCALLLFLHVAAALLSGPCLSQAAVYRCTDLNPGGLTESYGLAISGSRQAGIGDGHALLWFGTASSAVDLNPSNFMGSVISGISGDQQVGQGYVSTNQPNSHALLWRDSPSSVVDLNAFGLAEAQARGISGSQIVGWVTGAYYRNHAVLWSAAAHMVVDLHPVGFTESFGWGVSGNQQVGYGYGPSTADEPHALLWSGTAESVVDLNPSGFQRSIAYGIAGNQQVGVGSTHALLWSGTAGSVVDLNPSGFGLSRAYATSGAQQVGSGSGPATGGTYILHALVWSGTANSVVDLHRFLSPEYGNSEALNIDANGNIVGYATHIPTGRAHAILWTVVPESVAICNDPGQCGAVWTCPTGWSNITCNPSCGSLLPVGTTTVTCTTTNPSGGWSTTQALIVTVNDCEPPVVSCRPLHEPSGKRSATVNKNSGSQEQSARFYELLGHDNCDPSPRLYIQDSSSGFAAGPFASGDIVKIRRKTGRKNSGDLTLSRSPIVHIKLEGDGLLYGVDNSGNVGTSVLCIGTPGSQ